MLPLRITFGLKGKKGLYYLESILNIAERLKLYLAEFEPDEITLDSLLYKLSNKGNFAFKKIIRVVNVNLLEKILEFRHLFTDIQFELPYKFTKNKLQNTLLKLEKINGITISFFINNSNIDRLELFLKLAKKTNVRKVVVTNPDLIRHKKFVKNHYLTIKNLEKLDIIKKYMDSIEFSIHDFFIAKRLGIKDADLFRGCQAGKFLCYILNGQVYPCKTVPVKSGDIKNEPFEKIWSRVEKEINKISKGQQCITCENSKICHFGCPGTVFFINHGIKDPLCEQ